MVLKVSKLLCDTGVVSRIITKKPDYIIAKNEILKKYEIVISTVTKIELYNWIYEYKSKIDNKSSYIAEKLAVKCFKSGVGDLLTASIGIRHNLKIFTANTKHFKTIPGANLYIPSNFK